MLHVQSQGQWRPECAICKESVTLEESKTDENGQAIHEDCYVSRLAGNTEALIYRLA
jgi:hypothetical protein